MKLLLLLPLLLGLSSPVQARVDPEVHKLCKDVKDYLGCVKAQSGIFGVQEIITNPGTATSRGNECPLGYAYVGNGYCREVTCRRSGGKYSNNPLIGGKKWRCRPASAMESRRAMTLGSELRIGNNPSCPDGEPKIGWQTSCDAPYKEPPLEDRINGRNL